VCDRKISRVSRPPGIWATLSRNRRIRTWIICSIVGSSRSWRKNNRTGTLLTGTHLRRKRKWHYKWQCNQLRIRESRCMYRYPRIGHPNTLVDCTSHLNPDVPLSCPDVTGTQTPAPITGTYIAGTFYSEIVDESYRYQKTHTTETYVL
jgi:hypothetical protein